jgi:glycosyltransferase involved in cell wall biosynthesis
MQMKIIFLFSGIPHYYKKILNYLVSKGLEITIIIPKRSSVIGKGVKEDNTNNLFQIIYTNEIQAWYGKPYLANIPEILRNQKPNILVVGWPYILGFIFYPKDYLTVKKNKIKLVFREIPFMVAPFNQAISYYKKNPVLDENLNIENNKGVVFILKKIGLALLRKIYYKISDATLNYSHLAYEIQPTYGVKKENIYVTLNTVDTNELFEIKEILMKENISINYNKIIHVGRLVKWKRVDLLLKAVSIVKRQFPDIQLIVIGDGPELNNLKELASKLGINDSVSFEGAIYDYMTLGKYFLSSAIYVLAGMGGLSINEAMAFGKPVICSVCDGTEKFLVRNMKNGLFFKEGDSFDLAEKILFLLNNPKLIDEMGKESERIIREEINIEIVANNYISAFTKISRI